MALSPQGSLTKAFLSAISECRVKGEFTDLVLRHESAEFKVHKIVVCSQSTVLYKGCTGEFKEASTGVYEIVDISVLELEKLVSFFYQMDYNDELCKVDCQQKGDCVSLLHLHARMFAYGDKYDIRALRDVAARKYAIRCSKSWDPKEFLGSIHEVYESTPESLHQLRDSVTSISRKRLPMMLNDSTVALMFNEVIKDVPDYTRDLLRLYVQDPLHQLCTTCCEYQDMDALQTRCKKCKKGNSGWNKIYDV